MEAALGEFAALVVIVGGIASFIKWGVPQIKRLIAWQKARAKRMALLDALSGLFEDLYTSRINVKEFGVELRRLSWNLVSTDQLARNANAAVGGVRDDINKLSDTVGQVVKEHADLGPKVVDLSNVVLTLQNNVGELVQGHEQLTAEQASTARTVESISGSTAQLRKDLATLQVQHSRLSQRANELYNTNTEEYQRLNEKVNELLGRVAQLEQHVSTVRNILFDIWDSNTSTATKDGSQHQDAPK